jgi:protein-tyrosine-phosphatase
MALGFFTHLAGDQAAAYSGGSEPADQINEVAVAAMAEEDIDITTQRPRRWTDAMVHSADVIISMGCGDTCPIYPGHRYETWDLPRPRRPTPRQSAPHPRRNRTTRPRPAGRTRHSRKPHPIMRHSAAAVLTP